MAKGPRNGPRKQLHLSLQDLKRESDKFVAPATAKEKSIIEAAAALMGERGIAGATTAEIARRAGVTERTLFRYFPSKKDLVRRVMFPLALNEHLTLQWETFEGLLKSPRADFKDWYAAFTAFRFAEQDKRPALVRTLLVEVVENAEFRDAIAALWREHVWTPMIGSIKGLQAEGAVRADVEPEVLARAIHCLNIGYFFARHVLAPGLKWDDAAEIAKMSDILAWGCAGVSDAVAQSNRPEASKSNRQSRVERTGQKKAPP